MTTQQDFGGDIAQVVEAIRQKELADQQAAAAPPASEQTAVAATEPATKGEPAGEGKEATAAAPAQAEHGDVRGALRASRRSERQAREEATRLKAELEDARKQIPKAVDTGMSDADLAELEIDMPKVAQALKEVRSIKAAIAAAPAPAPREPDEPEFTPPVQPEAVQDVIDDLPALRDMQHDPDQSAFQLAIRTDALLREHPKWHDKPLAERLAECARRVQAELGPSTPAASPAPQPPASPAPATPQRRAAAAVQEAPRTHPSTLSDIAGGATPTVETPGLKQLMTMSNDEIMSTLERFG